LFTKGNGACKILQIFNEMVYGFSRFQNSQK
jgi:hypothetical protein